MREHSVFDVALELLKRAPKHQIQAVKLQKLVFYTFGWYAHVSGEKLFDEPFYAMKRGPVVGELLSAHSTAHHVTQQHLVDQIRVRDDAPAESDPYLSAVIDGVWAAYGAMSWLEIEAESHEEPVWKDAWDGRPEGKQRADISSLDIVEAFIAKPSVPVEARELMPPRRFISVAGAAADALDMLDLEASVAPAPLSDGYLRRLRQAIALAS